MIVERSRQLPNGKLAPLLHLGHEELLQGGHQAVEKTMHADTIVCCHRIVRQNGAPGGYRWGIERKKALLRHEKEVVADVNP